MSNDYDWETKQKIATADHWQQRAEKAESERDELKAIVNAIGSWHSGYKGDPKSYTEAIKKCEKLHGQS